MTNAEITGWGKCMPPNVLSNHDLEQLVDTSDEWITTRTGIKERRISHVETSDMAAVAGQHALAAAGKRPEDVDLLRRIRELLYKHGYTIKGVQKLLRDGARTDDVASSAAQPVVEEHEPMMPVGHARPAAAEPIAPPRPAASGAGRIDRASIESAITELEGLRQLLRARRR